MSFYLYCPVDPTHRVTATEPWIDDEGNRIGTIVRRPVCEDCGSAVEVLFPDGSTSEAV